MADPRHCSPRRSACRISCCRRRARWCRSGSRARGPAQAPIGCSRCRISPRCWRSSAIRSCSSRGRRRAAQALGWSVGYARVRRAVHGRRLGEPARAGARRRIVDARPSGLGAARRDDEPPPTASRDSCCGARSPPPARCCCSRVSNHITQNVASVPLLWIVPLAIYLLTFILCFDAHGLVPAARSSCAMLAAGTRRDGVDARRPDLTHELALQVGVFCAGLFLACMFCHGELVRLQARAAVPDALLPDDLARRRHRLGAGRHRRAARAARVLRARRAGWSLRAALLLVAGAARHARVLRCSRAAAMLVAIGCAVWGIHEFYDRTIVATRNFYGVLRVQEFGPTRRRASPLAGRTARSCTARSTSAPHSAARADHVLHETSGIGRLLETLHPRTEPLRVGVIGLGTGTLAVYGAKGDVYRFYDINPDVIDIASATSPILERQRGDDRDSRSATRGSSSSASRRSASTCSRSMPSRATRFRCTSSRRKPSTSTSATSRRAASSPSTSPIASST